MSQALDEAVQAALRCPAAAVSASPAVARSYALGVMQDVGDLLACGHYLCDALADAAALLAAAAAGEAPVPGAGAEAGGAGAPGAAPPGPRRRDPRSHRPCKAERKRLVACERKLRFYLSWAWGLSELVVTSLQGSVRDAVAEAATRAAEQGSALGAPSVVLPRRP